MNAGRDGQGALVSVPVTTLVYVNPPFSALLVWLRRAHDQWMAGNVETVVCLVPVRTDSAWFHDRLSADAAIYLLKGRVRFLDRRGGGQQTPFSLMLATLGATAQQKHGFAAVADGFWLERRLDVDADRRGMAHIQGVVNAMDFMFYPTGGVEAVNDGYIELRDAATGEVANALLQVQGKASERDRLQGDTGDTFEFPCSEADIAYWMQGTAPVLLVFVALKEGRAYWKSIKDWFSDPERVKARKIVFDRSTDGFEREAKAAISVLWQGGQRNRPPRRTTCQLMPK